MSLVLRYVTKDDQNNGKNIIKESFLGFAACGSLDAAGLCDTLLSNLRECGIDLGGCVAQCYDGAAVMSGQCSGVRRVSASFVQKLFTCTALHIA